MVNTVARQKPGALSLVGKAINSIWSNPSSLFVTVKAQDLLFDGLVIHCNVQDFAGKAICTQLKGEEALVHINDDDLAFSLMGPVSLELCDVKLSTVIITSHEVTTVKKKIFCIEKCYSRKKNSSL